MDSGDVGVSDGKWEGVDLGVGGKGSTWSLYLSRCSSSSLLLLVVAAPVALSTSKTTGSTAAVTAPLAAAHKSACPPSKHRCVSRLLKLAMLIFAICSLITSGGLLLL